jgi:Aromatic-ring-opening dioxygenase LigAB, LigA subunit
MTAYTLNKFIRELNRDEAARARFFGDPETALNASDLTPEEKQALLTRDVGALYRLGTHGLILRPFTILCRMSEDEYLRAIRS